MKLPHTVDPKDVPQVVRIAHIWHGIKGGFLILLGLTLIVLPEVFGLDGAETSDGANYIGALLVGIGALFYLPLVLRPQKEAWRLRAFLMVIGLFTCLDPVELILFYLWMQKPVRTYYRVPWDDSSQS